MRMLLLLVFLMLPWSSSVAQNSSPRIKIGFILSLTGSWGHFGEAQRHALEMARADREELFKEIAFIYEDCQYVAKNAVSAFNKLVNVDRVDVIFVWGVEPSLVVAPLAESRGVPLFVSALDPRAALERKFVIRTINYAAQHSEKLIAYLYSKRILKLAVVKSEISFFDVLVAGLQKHLRAGQHLQIFDSYLPDQFDFRSTISKLKGTDYDALGVYLGPNQVAQFFRQLSSQKVKMLTFGATPFQSRTVIRDAGGAMEDAWFAHNYVDESFRKRYIVRVGDDQQIPWAANAYDFAILMGETLGPLKGSVSAEVILRSATDFQERKGVGGTYKYVNSKSFGKYFEYPIAVYQVKGDDYVLLSR